MAPARTPAGPASSGPPRWRRARPGPSPGEPPGKSRRGPVSAHSTPQPHPPRGLPARSSRVLRAATPCAPGLPGPQLVRVAEVGGAAPGVGADVLRRAAGDDGAEVEDVNEAGQA